MSDQNANDDLSKVSLLGLFIVLALRKILFKQLNILKYLKYYKIIHVLFKFRIYYWMAFALFYLQGYKFMYP